MSNNQLKNKDLIVGLDIGTSKVVCLVGKYDSSDNLEILSLGTYPSSGLKKGNMNFTNLHRIVFFGSPALIDR